MDRNCINAHLNYFHLDFNDMIDYHNRRFRVVSNSDNGKVTEALIFTYQKEGNMTYQQIEIDGKIKTGRCQSKSLILNNEKIVLRESWE